MLGRIVQYWTDKFVKTKRKQKVLLTMTPVKRWVNSFRRVYLKEIHRDRLELPFTLKPSSIPIRDDRFFFFETIALFLSLTLVILISSFYTNLMDEPSHYINAVRTGEGAPQPKYAYLSAMFLLC